MKSRVKEPETGRRASAGNVTMADIGRLAGVSQVTVSRALSAPAKVSPETLERIREAIKMTGFVPNAVAGALASSKSRLISALVPSVTNIVYASMLHAFSNIMLGHGYQLMLSETGFDPEREEAAIETHLSRRPDAILLTGIHHSAGARRLLLGAGIPVVEVWDVTDTPIDCCVGFSHGEAGSAAAEFAHAAGYRHAATVTAGDERAIRRRNAFVDRFRRLSGGDVMGVDFDSTATLGAGRQALVNLLDRGMKRGSVVFCSSDQFAQGVLVEARARGLAVPGDVAVIGFGDQEYAAHLDPTLTSIRVDRDVLGRAAANAVLDRFNNRADVEAIYNVGFEIIRRASA